jgi:pimeloyl-ACP methyl ester carboxylesterase
MSSSARTLPTISFRRKSPTKLTRGISNLSIANTPLGPSNEDGASLLNGLDVYEVPSNMDGHPLSVYGINSQQVDVDTCRKRRPILLCHGRTWSAVPVYHLLGSKPGSRSLMESLWDTESLQPYMMDFRGFGGTPRDATGEVTPHTCVHDVESVLQWVAKKHKISMDKIKAVSTKDNRPDHDCATCDMPALLGWSQGALVTQLVAQRSPQLMSKLVLYGSIYDPLVRYPRAPLYAFATLRPDLPHAKGEADRATAAAERPMGNTYDAAIEDFTIEGTIAPEPARQFAHAALLADPLKAKWSSLHEFNNVDPARVHVPTLVMAGDQDPYAPLRVQQELFCNLGRGADRSWTILSGADHAVHLLDNGRENFVNILKNFVENHNSQPGSSSH